MRQYVRWLEGQLCVDASVVVRPSGDTYATPWLFACRLRISCAHWRMSQMHGSCRPCRIEAQGVLRGSAIGLDTAEQCEKLRGRQTAYTDALGGNRHHFQPKATNCTVHVRETWQRQR